MPSEFCLESVLAEVNDRREKAGRSPLSQRALAEAAGVDKDTVSRMARNVLIGKHLLGILDRLSTALSEAGDLEVRPGDLIRSTVVGGGQASQAPGATKGLGRKPTLARRSQGGLEPEHSSLKSKSKRRRRSRAD